MPYRPVIVNQMLSSSPASSGRSTPSIDGSSSSPPPSSTDKYRQYGAPNHAASVVKNSGTIVANHGEMRYDPSAPSPGQGGSYPRSR